jgi:TonB family protein
LHHQIKTFTIMTRGKSICNVLKTIRKQVADANEIKYESRECHHQGECRGTCPACEAEVRYLESQLNIRRQLGKAVAIMGISAGLSALVSCGDKAKKVATMSEEQSKLMEGKVLREPAKQLDGDVEYRSPIDTVIIEKEPSKVKKRTAKVVMGDVVEQMPSFPGGPQALLDYLSEHINYPEGYEETCVQGRVVITFVVEKDGSLSDVAVVKSLEKAFDEEALRAVKSMPNWIPGMQNGEPIRVKYAVPVNFRLK